MLGLELRKKSQQRSKINNLFFKLRLISRMALVAVKATHQALHQLYIAVALDPIAIDLEVKSVGIRLVEM
jgi:hypothetical protein